MALALIICDVRISGTSETEVEAHADNANTMTIGK